MFYRSTAARRSRAVRCQSVRSAARFLAMSLLAATVALHASSSARAELLLNEVLYDPEGLDEGLEFVELWNPGADAVSMEGVLLETADGASPGVWTPIFLGSPADSVGAGSAFLIAGESLLAAIQNGPDAIRLSRSGTVLDLLGYGVLTSVGLYEGAPASDPPSGQSLARVEDGVDTGWNASDWAPASDPSPGRPNHPDLRLVLARAGARLIPEVPWPGDAVSIRASVENLGRLGVEAIRWRIEAAVRRGIEFEGPWPEVPDAVCPGVALAPGESASVACSFVAPPPGAFALRLVLREAAGAVSGSGGAADGLADTVFLASRSVAGPLLVNEIAFRDRGVGEWVELLAADSLPDVGAFRVADATGRAYAIRRGSETRPARAGELLVVAEFPEQVRAIYALPESSVLGLEGGWPSLNDTDGAEGVADHVRVLDGSAAPADAVPYASALSARGASIERLGVMLPSASAGTWSESIDRMGGTPGRPNSLAAPAGGSRGRGRLLLAAGRVVRRGAGAVVEPVILSLASEARGKRVRVRVHDLLGRPRRLLLDGQRVSNETAFAWDGRDDGGQALPAGIYVVRADTIPEGGDPVESASISLSVVEGWAR